MGIGTGLLFSFYNALRRALETPAGKRADAPVHFESREVPGELWRAQPRVHDDLVDRKAGVSDRAQPRVARRRLALVRALVAWRGHAPLLQHRGDAFHQPRAILHE